MSDFDLVLKTLNDKLTMLTSVQAQSQQQLQQLQAQLLALSGAIQATNESIASVTELSTAPEDTGASE